MSIYQGDTKISGNAMMVALPMFFATYQPRKLNNASWLRADPYSWHSADVYVSAYAHLADNISGVTAQTETIAGTTITFYPLSDEIKVVLPDQETNVEAIYNATGIGYYFVLDTTNRQFKLPRNIYGFTGYRGDVGGYVAESLPNITGAAGPFRSLHSSSGYTSSGALSVSSAITANMAASGGANDNFNRNVVLNASNSSSTYQDNAPVQQRATQAYLYFYVGNTVQNETSVDVAEMTEALNDKVDITSSWSFPSSTYVDLTLPASGSTYTVPDDGYLYFAKKTNGNGQYVGINGPRISAQCVAYGSPMIPRCYLAVKKGDVCTIEYSAGDSSYTFRFVYAQKTN